MENYIGIGGFAALRPRLQIGREAFLDEELEQRLFFALRSEYHPGHGFHQLARPFNPYTEQYLAQAQELLFLDAPAPIVAALSEVIHGDIDTISRSLVIFLEAHQNTDVFRWCISDCINRAESYHDVFRDRTLSSQILTEYFSIAARNYLRDAIGTVIKKLTLLKKPLEVDPRVQTGNLEDNRKLLHDLAMEAKQLIFDSVTACPEGVRRTLHFLAKQLALKFKGDGQRVVPVFIFSRLFLPPLMQPAAYNILKASEPWTMEAARTAILLSKVLSNLASGTEFDEHNPLHSFNYIVNSAKLSLKIFVEKLVSVEDLAEIKGEAVMLPLDLVNNAFKCIHSHLYWAKEAIADYRKSLGAQSSAQDARLFFDLMSSLEDIELAEGKPDQVEMSMLDLEDATKREAGNANRSPGKRTGRPPSASFRDKSSVTKTNFGASGSSSPTGASTATGSAVPFVRQMSEKFNKEHQKLQLEAVRQKQQQEEKQKKLAEQKATKPTDPPKETAKDNKAPPSPRTHKKGKSKPSIVEEVAATVTSSATASPAPERAEKTAVEKPKASGQSDAYMSEPEDAKPTPPRPGSSRRRRPTKHSGDALEASTSDTEESMQPRSLFGSGGKRPEDAIEEKHTRSRSSSFTRAAKRGDTDDEQSDGESPLRRKIPREKIKAIPGSKRSGSPLNPGTPKSAPATPTIPPSSSSLSVNTSESMSALVRQLGVENAQLQKSKKDLAEQLETLQVELAKVKKDFADKEQAMSNYTNKLLASVAQRKQRDAQVKQAANRLKYGLRSFDDDDFDFKKSSPQERRAFFIDIVNYNSSELLARKRKPPASARRPSASGASDDETISDSEDKRSPKKQRAPKKPEVDDRKLSPMRRSKKSSGSSSTTLDTSDGTLEESTSTSESTEKLKTRKPVKKRQTTKESLHQRSASSETTFTVPTPPLTPTPSEASLNISPEPTPEPPAHWSATIFYGATNDLYRTLL